MLSKLCFKLSISRTFSMKEEMMIYILSVPMILPFPLLPKVIFFPSIVSRDVNYFISLVMYLEQSLSKYHSLFFSLVARHAYKKDQVFILDIQAFLDLFRLVEEVPLGPQTFLILLNFF